MVETILPNIDFLGAPLSFWFIVIALVLIVGIILYFVLRKKPPLPNIYGDLPPVIEINMRAPEPAQTAPQPWFVLSQSSSPQKPLASIEEKTSPIVQQPLPIVQQPLPSVQQLNTSAEQLPPVQPAAIPLQQKAPSSLPLEDSSMKKLLVDKFQPKIESQLGAKVAVSDFSAEGDKFFAHVKLAGVEIVLTLDSSGKIVDYKKLKQPQ